MGFGSRAFLPCSALPCHAACHRTANLFNVPSGKVTDLGELFFQEQFNFLRVSRHEQLDIDVAGSRV